MQRGKWSRISVGISVGMILCCATLTAQTNTFPSSGNVGIGTSSPGSSLEVHGNGTIASGLAITGSGQPYAYNHLYSGTTPEQSLNLFFGDTTTTDTYYGFNIQGGAIASPTNFFTVLASGNVGIGTTTPGTTLEVNGNVKLTSGSGASLTFPDGTVQSTAYTGTTCATGGDYAETVNVAGNRNAYEPGDVMVIGLESDSDVGKSSEPYSTRVAGIYSTKPGVVGRRQTTDPKTSTTEIPMAMVGIVPTKVSAENGAISRGDLLVTASIPGYAMKGTDRMKMLGAVVGKAMGTLSSGVGVVEVLVTLQ